MLRLAQHRRHPRARASSAASRRPHISQPELPLAIRVRTGATKVPRHDASARRVLVLFLGLVTAVLVALALVGERGLIQTVKARRDFEQVTDAIDDLRQENRRLRTVAERLRRDRSAIEDLARGELGLLRPGEQLFIVTERDQR